MRNPGGIGYVAIALSAAAVVLAGAVGGAAPASMVSVPSWLVASVAQIMGAGPADRPPVDAAAADRGKTTWTASCASCHGADARGTAKGKNLIRSLMVLHDRSGQRDRAVPEEGSPGAAPTAATTLTDAQISDLAHFLRQRVNDSFRGSPIFEPRNVLTGDAKAGETYFTAQGSCSTCHSPTGRSRGHRQEIRADRPAAAHGLPTAGPGPWRCGGEADARHDHGHRHARLGTRGLGRPPRAERLHRHAARRRRARRGRFERTAGAESREERSARRAPGRCWTR